MNRGYILISVSIISIVLIIIVLTLVIYLDRTRGTKENFNLDYETVISGANIDQPDLLINKQEPEIMSSIKNIITGVQKKIPFIVDFINESYTIDVPSYEDFNFNGKGLVIAGSGLSYRYVTGIFINVYIIRKIHNSAIPIEIFYVSKKEEFPKSIKNELLQLGGITIINLLDRISTNMSVDDLRGYQTKPLACLCSSFEEIVLMDADAISFINPTYLFNIAGYDSHGMVLFRDYVECLTYVSKDFINKIGIGSRNFCSKTGGLEIDSSCIVLNKKLAWEALYTICFINVKSDQYYQHRYGVARPQVDRYGVDRYVDNNVLGDKDIWLIGSMFVNFEPYIDTSISPSKISISDEVNGEVNNIDGHYQRAIITIDGVTEVLPIYYNNQKLKLENLNSDNIHLLKNNNRTLAPNVVSSLLACKDAFDIINNLLPYSLLRQKPVDEDNSHIYYNSFIP
jgi:hypothetical protein